MKDRHTLALWSALLATLLLTACTTPRQPSAQGPSGTATPTSAAPRSENAPSEVAVLPMRAETAAEKAAVKQVDSVEGRKWALGDPSGSDRAEGAPFLAGYTVALDDGKKQYRVKVIGGSAVPFFGGTGDVAIPGALGGATTIPPETARQKAAVESARLALSSKYPAASKGGMESYLVFFPRADNAGPYPTVAVYASARAGSTFAFGGTEIR